MITPTPSGTLTPREIRCKHSAHTRARSGYEGDLGSHCRQLANRAAKRLDFVMRVVRVHFRRCMTGKLLSDFYGHSGVRHDAREDSMPSSPRGRARIGGR